MPDLTPVGGEVLVNVATTGTQSPAGLAVLRDGTTVALFTDDGAGGIAKLRLFDSHEQPLGGEISLGPAWNAQVTALEGGGFAASWISTAADRSVVHLQTFDAAGHAVGAAQDLKSYDEKLDLASGINSQQHPLGLHMASLADGGYAVAWTVQASDSMSFKTLSIQGLIVHGDGQSQTLGQIVTGGTKALVPYDTVATPVQLADGRLMLTWWQQAASAPASPQDPVSGQHILMFDAAGAPIGAGVHLDSAMPADGGPIVDGSHGLGVAVLGDGDVAFGWIAGGKVWLSVYPESGLGQGNLSGRTAPVAVGDTNDAGAPQVAELGDGRLVVAWTADAAGGSDVLARIYSAGAVPAGAAFHLGDITSGAQDLALIAAHGDGLSTLWRDDSGLASGGGTADLSGAGVKLQLLGAAASGPHSLLGTAGPEVLAGGAGEDWLTGYGGADTLSGGFGHDKFILGQGAGVDRVLDFTAGEDLILVTDGAGAIADGSHGALIFDAASHTLSFDPDGGPGPAAAEPLAILDGVSHVGASDLAAGFAPHAIKVIAADGSMEKTVFDGGGAAWASTVTQTSAAGAVTSYTVNQDDGSHWTTWFDAPATETWSSRTAVVDAAGAVSLYAVTYDDGRREVFSFDTQHAQPWSRMVDDYDAAGRLATRATVYDDGVVKVATLDADNSHPWSMLVDVYDAAGRLTGHWTYNDDGTFVG
ncbi:calcium-binding protein [Phenylobacterium soli]|uniref:Calcium-binding protein n=1 Tax=Phenylobacterium soli TaxID=2170551 RepID=A0A328AGR8_9CAUL|nr:hypothetical protein [Phenylobacterium soli]RAK54063.1 hypothetical protein DJ017_05760 [Phenylobacterium soli]